ncbi:MAG: glycoside hydrolase family 16 protein [Methylobacterium sp.]|uniref:glycoside hydrolase family 16 protein n=1 Tax=Methylobacterium sp. TaxID=409 RepID=UPI0025DE1AE6|nr:glycoside hydrolase family 16 protein [Methylobacterium sp.]MBX9932018.1 glycoside hydrolase family 16 protein [Methylobacterium sp.]
MILMHANPTKRRPTSVARRRPRSIIVALLAMGLFIQAGAALSGAQPQVRPDPFGNSAFGLQLTSPGPTGVSVHNQISGPAPSTVSIADAAMRVRSAPTPIVGIAKGLRTVAVVVGGKWHVVVPDAEGHFSATVDLTNAERGPLVIDVHGWDTLPDNHNYKAAINLRIHVFVERLAQPAAAEARRAGHPASGRRLVWSDEFDGLAKETWHLGPKPDGQEYGAAAFATNNDVGSYTAMDGFLRIRASHQPNFKDERGWNRKWVTGHLSTGFPDGSARAAFRKGYFEARMLVPAGPGCWSSFWLLDQHGIRTSNTNGAVEIDVIEAYGHSNTSYVATEHDWPPPSAGSKGYRRAQKNLTGLPDLTLGFHDYGVEITDDDTIYYFDGKEVFRAPLYRKDTVSPFFLMLTLAMSHDWPIVVPPSGYYDLWIDRVRVYR